MNRGTEATPIGHLSFKSWGVQGSRIHAILCRGHVDDNAFETHKQPLETYNQPLLKTNDQIPACHGFSPLAHFCKRV